METTTDDTAVPVQSIEAQLTDLLLNARGNSLPNGPNGHPKAPPPKVAATRKMIRQGLRCPFRALLEVMNADTDDDVALSEVNASLYRLIAHNEARAIARHLARRDRPVPVLLTKAQKEIGEYQLAALRLANSPESLEAAEAVIREAADLPPVVSDLSRACQLAVVRHSSRPARRFMEHVR